MQYTNTYLDKNAIFTGKRLLFNAGVESALQYAEPQKHYAPKVQLLFSPYGLPFVPIEVLGTNAGGIISGFTWTKDRNSPGGLLSVSMTPDKKIIQEMVDSINKLSGGIYSAIWGELGTDLEDLFKPMTLCQLWIDGYHVMIGTVRSCIRSSSSGDNSREVTYSVAIDELGNLYNKNILSFDTLATDSMQQNIADSLHFPLDLVSALKLLPLAEGIKALFSAWIATTLNTGVSFSDGLPLALRMLPLANPIGGIANLSYAQNMIVDASMFEVASQGGSQSFWSFLQSFIPSPWMEFYTESGGRTIVTDAIGVPAVLAPGFNYIVARSLPYSNPLIGTVNPAVLNQTLAFDLTAVQMLVGGDFVIVTDEDIISKSLGVDCSSQATVFHARYGAGGATTAPDSMDKPIHSVGALNPFASGGMSTFGMIDMMQSINCTHLLNAGTAVSVTERIAKNKLGLPLEMMGKPALANLLATWFRNQSRFREGSITTRYIPYARAGMYLLYLPSLSGRKVENVRDIGIYYIDSLSHAYAIDNETLSFTTTFNVIRGCPLPTTIASTALLLFDWEILPPESGLTDGKLKPLIAARKAVSGGK
jgi:hypothetical protein